MPHYGITTRTHVLVTRWVNPDRLPVRWLRLRLVSSFPTSYITTRSAHAGCCAVTLPFTPCCALLTDYCHITTFVCVLLRSPRLPTTPRVDWSTPPAWFTTLHTAGYGLLTRFAALTRAVAARTHTLQRGHLRLAGGLHTTGLYAWFMPLPRIEPRFMRRLPCCWCPCCG